MKILITGGAGFIGYHLAKKFLSTNHVIHLLDLINPENLDSDIQKLLKNKNYNYFQANMLENNFKNKIDKDYDFIIHLSAIVGVENVISDSFSVLKNNTLMLLNILDFLKLNKNSPRLIFASTSEVYAGSQKNGLISFPTKEDSLLVIPELSEPRTSYMLSKIYGEALCYACDFDCLIIRPHNIYGPRMGMKHVIPQLMKKIINAEKYSSLDVFSPKHTRTFCFVDYAVEKIKMLVEKTSWNKKVLNLGVENQEIEIKSLAKILLKVTGREDLSINELQDTMGSPSRRVPSTNLLTQETDTISVPTLEQGVIETYNWYKDKLA